MRRSILRRRAAMSIGSLASACSRWASRNCQAASTSPEEAPALSVSWTASTPSFPVVLSFSDADMLGHLQVQEGWESALRKDRHVGGTDKEWKVKTEAQQEASREFSQQEQSEQKGPRRGPKDRQSQMESR